MADSAVLSRVTTKAASLQTFSIIRVLVNRGRRHDAYRAYAYFRWLDDWLDGQARDSAESLAFVERQCALIERCYTDDPPAAADEHEQILVDLIRSDPDRGSPLAVYINHMMAVMAFDAGRRGRLISQGELNDYQRSLAIAVTEAMYYFIGDNGHAPQAPGRYLAVAAAHITHMLRDTSEDLDAGYFNIPSEYVRARDISPQDVDSAPYQEWVRMRVELARQYFKAGSRYLKEVRSARCRLAAYAYTARFETVLDMIEHDGFRLRYEYGASKTPRAGMHMAASVLFSSLGLHVPGTAFGSAHQDRASGTP
jgi:phytoene/squalene synthetase